MTLRPFSSLVLLLCLLLVGSASALAQTRELSSTGQLLDGIAAIVNDGVVLKSELDAELRSIVQRLQAQGTPVPPAPQLIPQVLERLVIQEIQLQRASRIGILVSDETLNAALADVAQRNGVSLADLPGLLASEGIDYSTYRSDLRKQITIDQLRQRDVIARINVTPRELDEYLERQRGREFYNQEFEISQILISVPIAASSNDIARAEQRVEELQQRIENGESFSELAVSFSDGQQALNGGNLGWRKGDELPTVFSEVVPGLQVGQVSEPIRSNSGFHLVRLNNKRGGDPIMEDQVRVRHILITTNEVLDDDAARQKLAEVREQILTGDDFAAVAKVLSEDPGSAIEGGDLGWSSPRVYAPEFARLAESMPIGEITEPFRTQFGWHILEVMDRRTQDTTDDVKRRQAIGAIRNSKLGEETELWARRLRDQAFVEYRL
jgi:peptidyl-prolyl cis-trans isomerase SurA